MTAAQQVLDAVKAAGVEDPHQVPDEPLLQDTETLLEARRLLDAELVRRLQAVHFRDVTAELCGRGTRAWLIEQERLAAADAGRLIKVARMLPLRPQLADALAAGDISVDHAAPILSTVAKLHPSDRDIDEKILITAAHDLDPDAIRGLCRKVEDAALCNEAVEARRERLYGTRYLRLDQTFDGMWHLDAMLPPEDGAALNAVIEPLAQRVDAEDVRSAAQRRADALATLASAAAGFDKLVPEFNGDRPHLNVTTSYRSLVDGLGRFSDYEPDNAPTIDGIAISPENVRMLACDAEIIPIVLGGPSEVLDVGRTTRIWPKAIRKALQLEDRGCGWPECKMPLWACRIHHITYWFHGGGTSKNNGVHLCKFHHWLIHNRPWIIRRNAAGRIEVRRT